MSPTGPERKAIELDCKLASLSAELAAWEAESEAGGFLEKHHTQIRAVTHALEQPLAAASERLDAAGEGGLLFQASSLEVMVLELHRIWHFFREKLALRYVEHFAAPLLAADELAWSCYQPAQSLIPVDRGREPPLVYFNGASSPLTLERGKRFQAEAVLDRGEVEWAFAARAVQSLPVPVVGLPWFQISHLPDAPIVAHEVGHDVEVDLGLSERVAAILDGAVPETRRPLWAAWEDEVFADVYGAVALGPAFAAALRDFLAGDRDLIAEEERFEGDGVRYPTAALRILLAAAVLEATEFEAEGSELRAVVPEHAMPEFEADVEPVAAGLIAGPYPELDGIGLDDLVGFGRTRQKDALADSRRLLRRTRPQGRDVRALVAAARLAYDGDPRLYVDRQVGARVIRHIKDQREAGTRREAPADAMAEGREQRDREAGAALLMMLDDHLKGDRDV